MIPQTRDAAIAIALAIVCAAAVVPAAIQGNYGYVAIDLLITWILLRKLGE